MESERLYTALKYGVVGGLVAAGVMLGIRSVLARPAPPTYPTAPIRLLVR